MKKQKHWFIDRQIIAVHAVQFRVFNFMKTNITKIITDFGRKKNIFSLNLQFRILTQPIFLAQIKNVEQLRFTCRNDELDITLIFSIL